jgi:YVTN family beta-propeller protein
VTFSVPGVPRELVQAVGVALTPDGSRAYVALGPANRVAEVDLGTLAVTRIYLVGQRVWGLALSPDGRRLYAANGNSGDVSVIDLATRQVVASVPVGRAPWGLVSVP